MNILKKYKDRKFLLIFFVIIVYPLKSQSQNYFIDYNNLTKRVYSFTKEEFINKSGEFDESICTLNIPDLKVNNPPYVVIYYKRENSNWFTESLYRKRVRFSFRDGILKLDRTNFWDWFELEEIKVVVLF